MQREEKPQLNFGSSFCIFFFLPLSLLYVIWASQEGCLFSWGSHSGPRTFLCSIFGSFSLLCLSVFTILDSFFLFSLLNTSYPSKSSIKVFASWLVMVMGVPSPSWDLHTAVAWVGRISIRGFSLPHSTMPWLQGIFLIPNPQSNSLKKGNMIFFSQEDAKTLRV